MYSALLDCTHYVRWREWNHVPRVGDATWCFRCDTTRTVRQRVGPYHLSCTDCTWPARTHSTFAMKPTALTRAAGHLRTHPLHRIRLWRFGFEDDIQVLSSATYGRQPSLFERSG